MPTKRVGRRLVVLSATAAACTGAMSAPAAASENILAAGNGAYGNTMLNTHKEVTAVGQTAHGSGLAGSLVQLPVNRPENGGGGGSLLFSERELKTAVTAVVWER
ncbi:hypothetical protein OG413_28350 [Streptomyces sp. NBC_01433]|uniref:hypothetical protein n=1 Tax=Streptomyces sp. NBC_01433 TaxID=2903864 RepID=UPI00224F43B7|nr:hypothetical protein [Streptomyces sp. NBC_01433]MCX4679170.1 hypothetical protein [Streptomyces sp. NBC_01433]